MIEWIFSFSHLGIELKFKICLFKIKLLLCDLSLHFYLSFWILIRQLADRIYLILNQVQNDANRGRHSWIKFRTGSDESARQRIRITIIAPVILTKVRIHLILNWIQNDARVILTKFRMTIALSLNLSEITTTTEWQHRRLPPKEKAWQKNFISLCFRKWPKRKKGVWHQFWRSPLF